jgi:hypothetical protein
MEDKGRGQPKKFKSGEELITLWNNFCEELVTNGYSGVPTQTAFCKWLRETYSEVDRRTIYNSLNEYFPTIKEEFERIQGDVITTGAMLGKYNPTMSIFALKNWCNWKDKSEIEQDINAKNLEVTINVID